MLTKDDLSAIQREAMVGVDRLSTSVAIVHDGKILVCRRSATEDFLPGYSELIGGGVDEGESLWDATHREVAEEAGIVLSSILKHMPGFEYVDGGGRRVRECSFVATTDSPEVRLNPAEHDAYAWVDSIDALGAEVLMTPEQRSLVINAVACLRGSLGGKRGLV